MTNATKYRSDDLVYSYATHEPQNADNTRKFGLWFNDKLREAYATNDFNIVIGWQQCL